MTSLWSKKAGPTGVVVILLLILARFRATEDVDDVDNKCPSSSDGAAAPHDRPAQLERTFVMVKPEGLRRGLVGEVMHRLERKGFKLVALKLIKASLKRLEQHYEEHRAKGFFRDLVDRMAGQPVVPMIWEGPAGTVGSVRLMLGPTDPLSSPPGTIRGDLATSKDENLCHGSDSPAAALREIRLWFDPKELLE